MLPLVEYSLSSAPALVNCFFIMFIIKNGLKPHISFLKKCVRNNKLGQHSALISAFSGQAFPSLWLERNFMLVCASLRQF